MYNHNKHFCRYFFKAFSTQEILKHHIKDCFKINGKQRIIIPKKDEYVKFRNYEKNNVATQNLCRFRKYFNVRR